MPITIEETKHWKVIAENPVDHATLSGEIHDVVVARPDSVKRVTIAIIITEPADEGGYATIVMTADDFALWSRQVLAKARAEGWRPKR